MLMTLTLIVCTGPSTTMIVFTLDVGGTVGEIITCDVAVNISVGVEDGISFVTDAVTTAGTAVAGSNVTVDTEVFVGTNVKVGSIVTVGDAVVDGAIVAVAVDDGTI